jgi:hypothetical protein
MMNSEPGCPKATSSEVGSLMSTLAWCYVDSTYYMAISSEPQTRLSFHLPTIHV